MDWKQLLEEADVLNKKALALYEEIQAGDRPIEDREQADALIKEAGEKADLAKSMQKAASLDTYLNEGQGSLTAGASADGNGGSEPQPPTEWKSFNEFLWAVTVAGDHRGTHGHLRHRGLVTDETMERLRFFEQKALEEGVGAAGGYLVPIAYRPELFMKATEAAIVRPRATVIPMSTRQVLIPSLDQTGTPDEQLSAFFGGLYFQWIEEAAAKPEVDIQFKEIDLTVHELAGWVPVSNNLIADSAISLDGLLRNLFGKAMADAEDYWFIQGDGVGKPWGVIHSPATIQPTRAGATAIVWADVIKMLHAFQPGANGVWVIHICAMEQILKLKDENSNYMWIPNMRDGMPERLMGYPILWSEKAAALGSKGDINLCDFSYYLIGDRTGPAIESSTEERFRYNQTTYRISERIDGKPWLSEPVALRPAGASEISPFVSLDAYGA